MWIRKARLLTPAVRASIYHALALMPTTKATTATIAGKGYDVVCSTMEKYGDCLLFDSATGRVVGSALTGTDLVLKADNFTLVDYALAARPDPTSQPKLPAVSADPKTQASRQADKRRASSGAPKDKSVTPVSG